MGYEVVSMMGNVVSVFAAERWIVRMAGHVDGL